MENIWKITYIKNNNPVVHFFNSKIHAIKILKNDKDYTNTLNKFLYK